LTSVYCLGKEWVLAVGNDGIFSLGRIINSPESPTEPKVVAEETEEEKMGLVAKEKLCESLGRLFGKLKRD